LLYPTRGLSPIKQLAASSAVRRREAESRSGVRANQYRGYFNEDAMATNGFVEEARMPENDADEKARAYRRSLDESTEAWVRSQVERANVEEFPQSDIDIVAPDGSVRHRTKAAVRAKSVTVWEPSLVIEPGDEILRRIPSGREETFEVVDPVFHEKEGYTPAHYQVEVRRKDMFPSCQDDNYRVHIISSPNARVNIRSHDHSTNIASQGDIFGDISAALQGVVKNADELRHLLSVVDEMKRQRGGTGFVAAYRSFVSLAADHLGILAPFLPALSQLL
jgi:hypothetical protein